MENINDQIKEIIKNMTDEKENIQAQLDIEQKNLDRLNKGSTEFTLTEDDGFIEVRNGELFVRNPKENGRQPVLYPHPKIYIFVNGKEIKQGTVVRERDDISWKLKALDPFSIKVSHDKQKVFLTLHPIMVVNYRLKTKKRALKFRFELEQFEKEIDVEKYSSIIIDEILKMGIKCEINMSAILDELKSPTFVSIIVAEGLPVIESRDAYIDTNFPTDLEILLEEVDGKVDFKNRIKIPSAEPGDIIAHVHKALEGKDGQDVYGDIIHPTQPKRLEVRTKNKTELTQDGRVIALQSGRPTVTGSAVKYFDILRIHEVNSDVNFKTGNIHFNGDVVVHGHVKDGMRVDALGNVYIKGNVYSATIVSAQNVYIEGAVINSKVFAGQHGMLINQIYNLVQDMNFTFGRLISAVEQVVNKLDNNRDLSIGRIIRLLVEQKFKKLDDYVNNFFEIINEAQKNKLVVPVHLIVLKRTLNNFKNHHLIQQIETIDVLKNIKFSLKEVIFQAESAIMDDSEIIIKEADMSEVKSNGKITVKGAGTINTTIFSGAEVVYLNKDSVIRGGKIEAVNKITAGIVGTEKGANPYLAAGNQIEAIKVYNADLKIKNATKIIYETKHHVVFSYEEATESIISYSRDSKVEI